MTTNNLTPIFECRRLKVLEDPADGPRGARLVFIVEGGEPERLLEGEGRRLHLAIRNWRRRMKELRGETERGRRKYAERQAGYAGTPSSERA